ncbi:hypothetical protein G6F56_008322 [Rhizopus delemar]|nr:hypothetical protein G6F56_008322 [Rhizopus delemar]
MTVFADQLPREIFDRLCHYLTSKQKSTCQTVCQAWRPLFASSQYRNIHIRGQKQFCRFFSSLSSNGHHIKKLHVEDVYLFSGELELLSYLCPNIYALTLHAVELSGLVNSNIFSQWKYLKCLDQDILKNTCVNNLSHLSIYLSRQSLFILREAKGLKDLTIKGGCISLADLEMVHEACPLLQKLSLKRVSINPLSKANRPLVAKHLKSFLAEDIIGLDKSNEWLYYFALKYPNLTHLVLWGRHTPLLSTNSLAWEERCQAMAQIGYRCRALRSLHLLNIPINHCFFEAMDCAGTALESIGFGDLTDHTLDTLYSLARSRQQISHLTLWGWPTLCIEDVMEGLMALLAYCDLESLDFSMQFSGIRHSPFPISLLLSGSPKIKTLRLGQVHAIINAMDRQHSSSLEQLTLYDCMFRNQLFEGLADHCPRLSHLVMNSCKLMDEPNQNIVIRMPQHSLLSLCMDRMILPSNYYHMRLLREIKMFDVVQAFKERQVYELTDYEGSRPTNCVTLASKQVSNPCVSIQCALLGELTISGFLMN